MTRKSLVDRLADHADHVRWQEFFDTYWKLIYGVARKSGLTETEAQEVVQETLITVSKKIDSLKYDPAIGSFKGWLLTITRWRIVDQFRKRLPIVDPPEENNRATAAIDRAPDPEGGELEALWEREWQENLIEAAMDRVRKRIDPKQFQIFDCYIVKGWDAGKVARELRVNIAQVYLARHRVGAQLRAEVRALERTGR